MLSLAMFSFVEYNYWWSVSDVSDNRGVRGIIIAGCGPGLFPKFTLYVVSLGIFLQSLLAWA